MTSTSAFYRPITLGHPLPYVPSIGTLIAAACNPGVAMANDFTRSLQADPGVLFSPAKYLQACLHAWMVGCASAVWTYGAMTQPVGVTAGLIPARR